jgi:hypothetical protein
MEVARSCLNSVQWRFGVLSLVVAAACSPGTAKKSGDAGGDVAGTGGAKPAGGTSASGGSSGSGGRSSASGASGNSSGAGAGGSSATGGARDAAASSSGASADASLPTDSLAGGVADGSAGGGGQDGAVADAPKPADAVDAPLVSDAVIDTQAVDGARAPLPATCPSPVAKGGASLLIDDLSSGNAQIAVSDGRNGLWFDYTDGTGGTITPAISGPFQVVLGTGPRGGYAARIAGSGFTSWGAAIGFNLSQSTAAACPYDASAFSGITFWAKAAAPLVARLNVVTTDTQASHDSGACASACNAVAAVWQKYTFAFTDLTRRAGSVDAQVAAFDATRVVSVEFQVPAKTAFDLSVTDISFTPAGMFGPHPIELCPDIAFDPAPMPTISHPAPVTFTIDATDTTKKHPISPLIYGSNGSPYWSNTTSKQFRRYGHSLLRAEDGDISSTYNWEVNAYTPGYCGSIVTTLENKLSPSDAFLPAQVITDGFTAAAAGSRTLLVGLSLLDYVAADGAGALDPSDPSLLSTHYKQNKPAKGSPFSLLPDTSDGFVYQDELVNWVMRNRPANVPVLFQLDNEPNLWDASHPNIHRGHVGYDEYVNRTVALAKATKTVAPDAEIVGIVAGSSPGVLETLSDCWSSTSLTSAADLAKGPFLEYFLSRLKTEGTSFGRQLIDYVDLHYYLWSYAGTGTASDPYVPPLDVSSELGYTNQNPEVLLTRLQVPRTLWDPTFSIPTFVCNSATSIQNQALTMIPGLKKRIAAIAPGVKLSLSEWEFGGGNHISGALAMADAFGIFGREGVDLAAHFVLHQWENYGWGAMQAFRNYNGLGGHFGDISVSATTSDVAATSVYASLDSQDPSRMVIVAINKTSDPITANVSIAAAPATFAKANVFVLAEGATYVKGAASISNVTASGFTYTMPRFSVSVLVPKVADADDELPPFMPDCVRTGNLALSSDFEENADGWMAWGGPGKTVSTDTAHTGTHSLRVTNRTQSWQGPAYQLVVNDSNAAFNGTLRNGYRYDVSGWVRIAGASSAPVNWILGTHDDTGDHYASGASQTATSAGWVAVSASFTPSIVGTLMTAGITLAGAPAGVDIYLDDVTITATKLDSP